jgi:phosphoribosylamine---glycine ligase
MKVLIVGGGGREHALGWAIARSPRRPEILAAPGNAGLLQLGRLVPIPVDDIEGLAALAARERVDLTVVGPEAPLVAGIVDLFRARGLRVFGPEGRAAILEGSKVFSKELMRRHGIPTAPFEVFSSERKASAYFQSASITYPKVIKADGLAAGKGVLIVETKEDALEAIRRLMLDRRLGSAGEQIIVEEYLEGEEVSVFALCRGTEYSLLPTSQDHKRLLDGDRGPNTGGMGAYAPYPGWTPELEMSVRAEIIAPTLRAMKEEGRPYHGLLYLGLMLVEGSPLVLEYNCRFGDPETQAVLPLIDGDVLEALEAASLGTDGPLPRLGVRPGSAAVVVLASGGYPDAYPKGLPISGIEAAAELPRSIVFHAGTRAGVSRPLTNGGRVLGVVGTGADLREALRGAYEGVSMIEYEGKIYRKDIGRRGLQ